MSNRWIVPLLLLVLANGVAIHIHHHGETMSENLWDEDPIDKRMVLEELKRELAMRRNVFPAWVKNGRLDQATADHRIRCLQEAIKMIEENT